MAFSASKSRSRIVAGLATAVVVTALAAVGAVRPALAAPAVVGPATGADGAVAAYAASPAPRFDRYADRSDDIRRPPAVSTAFVAVSIARMLSETSDGAADDLNAEERAVLREFYVQRGFTPTWIDGFGLNVRASALFAVLSGAADEGLEADDYAPADLTAAKPATAAEFAALEVGVSTALLRYISDMRLGSFSSRGPNGAAARRSFDAASALAEAAAAENIGAHLFALAAADPRFDGLRRTLRDYRKRAASGGWPAPAPDRLEPGSEGESVLLLRKILHATGDLHEDPAAAANPSLYDDALTLAVRSFQARHGLEADGVVGKQTRLAMAVPVEDRIRQILLNMERLRRLPEDLGDPHILVNVAGFKLDYVENGRSVFEMRTIVGKPKRSTPEFSGLITYLEINPTWTVPRIIAVEDLLPRFRDNPEYLAAKGYSVFRRDGGVVDPAAIDWRSAQAAGFPYWLRQKPGPGNALGRIKFMFPNAFDVYLHDTPSRGLFSRTQRAFSSGCIRVEQPLDLAVKLLEANGNWSEERIRAAIASGTTRAVTLSRPVPVHLAYLTAWRAADGTVHFRDDIYGRDETLEAALSAEGVELARASGRSNPLQP